MLHRPDADRGTAETAPRLDHGARAVHGADAQRVDRAHSMQPLTLDAYPMLGRAIGQRIGTDDALAVEDDQITLGQPVQQRVHPLDGMSAQRAISWSVGARPSSP